MKVNKLKMATLEKTTQQSSESFADLFEESMALKEMRQGEIITAEVISIDSDFVIVNAGLKSESLIKTDEFLDNKGDIEVNIGDHVKVSIEKLEDGYGSTILSRVKAKQMQAWIDLEDAMNDGTIVNGFVSTKVKGGLRVTVNGIMAFLPTNSAIIVMILVVLLIGFLTYGVRGVYWATLAGCNVPNKTKGLAIGVISMIGYFPEFYLPLISAPLLEYYPGVLGYQIYYLMISFCGLIGAYAAYLLMKPKS